MSTNKLVGIGLVMLAGLVILYVVMRPLLLDLIHFRTAASGLNQIRGGDLAALLVVAPAGLVAGAMASGNHPGAPVMALAPALFDVYLFPADLGQ